MMAKGFFRLLLIFFLAAGLHHPGFSQIVNIENERISSDTTGWDGQLEGALDLSQNSKFLLSANTKAHVQHKWKKDLLLVLGDWHFVSGDNTRFLNDGMGHLRYSHKFSKWVSMEMFSQIQYNELLNVDMRLLEGIGARFKLSQAEKYKAYLGVLYMFEYEQVALPDTLHLDHRMSAYFTFNLRPNAQFSFGGTNYYQPLLKNWSDFRLSGTYSLRFNMAKRLQFKLDFNYQYDSNPPQDIPRLVYSLRPGLIFKFRP